MNKPVYLDYAAATPLDERVFLAMKPFLTEQFYNPSSAYQPAREVRVAYEDARHRLAVCIGASRDEVIITAGATESINLAFAGLLSDGDHVVIGATEHAAVRSVAAAYDYEIAESDSKGFIQPEQVKKVICDKTKLVSVAAADSELGTVQSLSKIAAVIREVREDRRRRGVTQPIYFHSDGSQAAGAVDLHVSRLGVDMLTMSAAKCYGPKQVGLLWIASSIQLTPLVRGGGQERGLRSGTENVAGAVGFATALEYVVASRRANGDTMRKLRDEMQRLLSGRVDNLVINGSETKRLPGHLHVGVSGLDAERVVFNLDMRGVLVATGAACAANSGTRSSVLEAVGMDHELADGSLRISLGARTSLQDVTFAAQQIADAVAEEMPRS